MSHPSLRTLSKRIRRIDPGPFAEGVGRYIRLSRELDELLDNPDLDDRRIEQRYEECCNRLFRARDILFDLLEGAVQGMVELRCPAEENAPQEAGNGIRRSFYRLKGQQMELLFHIRDEVRIMADLIDGSRNLRVLVHSHTRTLRQAHTLLGHLEERFSHRPKAQELALAERGGKILRIGQPESESPPSAVHCSNPALAQHPYDYLVKEGCEELEQRRAGLVRSAEELREGWELLRGLLAKGRFPETGGGYDLLLYKHECRRRDFERGVREGRRLALGHEGDGSGPG